MSALRVGIDCRLMAYRRAGIASHVEALIDGFGQLAHRPELVLLRHRREQVTARPRKAERSSSIGLPSRWLWTPPHHRCEDWLVPLELIGSGVRLLHATDFILPRWWRGAGVITVHDLTFLRHPEFLTPESARYYGRVHASLKRAARVIAVSEHTRRELVALTRVAPERIRVVPNALRPMFLAPTDPAADAAIVARHGLREPFLLFVSTIEPRKNVDALLTAFRALLDQGRQLQLALVGADGWNSAATYRRAEELRLAHAAHFLGFVPDRELLAFYRRAAVLVHPAHDEGFGFAPLEAMACGTPVVVADAGALPEVVGDSGLRVAPHDQQGWSAAIARLLDDPALADQLAQAGRQRAAQFTTRRMAEMTAEVYREAWADSRRQPNSAGPSFPHRLSAGRG